MHFSDGNAAQYKNRKEIINIYHEQDFGLSAEWHFFTTSHGKGPASGIGGAVKRLAAKASLQNKFLTIRKSLQNDLISQLQYQELKLIIV
jgi:hypothetical protein